jgi:predicted transposase/invertase (TIGR01784 family)
MENIAMQDPLIGRALTVEDIFTKVDEERFMYELRERNRHDYINAMNTAEKRGIEKGEKKALRETARLRLADGMDPALIAQFTNLPLAEIEALRVPN